MSPQLQLPADSRAAVAGAAGDVRSGGSHCGMRGLARGGRALCRRLMSERRDVDAQLAAA